ncbi:MAG: hypothetical protein AB8B73_08680 [Ekhidna sp.]
MDQNKIDRLFREKMDKLEVIPSEAAWSQVEKQIRAKREFKIYWTAAAVTLIFAAWAFWPSQTVMNQTPIASEVSYPQKFDATDFHFSEIKVAKVKKEVSNEAIRNVADRPTLQLVSKVDEQKEEVKPALEELIPLEIDTKTAVATVELETPETIEELKSTVIEDFTAVKITYISSASNDNSEELQKTDSANAFKKIVAFAGKITPSEMMAEFKSAKDNLLNNGFKKKEKNSL